MRAIKTSFSSPPFALSASERFVTERSARKKTDGINRGGRTRRETTWEEAEQAGEREFSDTKASLRGGLDLTSILGRVHSRRRRREESVPSPGASTACHPARCAIRISVLSLDRGARYDTHDSVRRV